jgi:hypothetical protein
MGTYIADRIRYCVDRLRGDPDPDICTLDELLRVAVAVERQERVLDEAVSDARREMAIETFRVTVAQIMGHGR